MATWEDGPEYAPLARPEGFAPADAEPLPTPPAARPETAPAPAERPAFAGPAAPVAALETLAPPVADPRDPRQPFEVVSSSLTPGSAWEAAHGSLPLGAAPAPVPPTPSGFPDAVSPPAAGWPAPAPLPAPAAALPGSAPPSGPAVPSGFPQPGTPQWFVPGQLPEPAPRPPLDGRRVVEAATPGLLICLAIGLLLYPLAPVLLVISTQLARRVEVAQPLVSRVFGGALGLAGLLAVLNFLTNPYGLGDWWLYVARTAQVLSGLLLVAVVVLVVRGLRTGSTPPSPRGPWG